MVLVKVRRIEEENPMVMTLQFSVTEPQNPFIVYILDNGSPVAEGLKYAVIEGM